METIQLGPQPGFQVDFLKCPAKEAFTGGEAGGGKSIILILDATRYIDEPYYRAIIFRRTSPQLEELLREASQIYPGLGGKFNGTHNRYTWSNGASIQFSHMQHLKDMYSHMGQAYDFIGFDELPHFPKAMYMYLFSRLRGKNPNIKRYIRGTGNPDGAFVMWVKHRFVDSLPPNTTGYFKTVNDRDVRFPKGTKDTVGRMFIPCIRSQNRILMDNDPDYEAMLEQLPEDKKRALKYGLWEVQDKPNQLILSKWWEDSLNGKNEYVDDGNFTVANDFGHTGVDLSVELLGKGNRPYRFRSWQMTKTTEMADILALTCGSVARSRVMVGVDCIGPGAGVGDDIETHHAWLAPRLERCTHKDPTYEPRYKGEIAFDNLRSQMWWCFREDMQDGNIDLSAFMAVPQEGTEDVTEEQKAEGYFDDFNMLQEEIFAHTFRIHNGKLIVIPKAELRKPDSLGRSPDYADTIVIWNWVRRMHQKADINLDEEYQVDEYMREYMKKEFDHEYEDQGVHTDHGEYDEGVYE